MIRTRKILTWNKLLRLYTKAKGIKKRHNTSMETVLMWAYNQPGKFYVKKNGSLELI